jgi:predicted RNase H-like HicB family nuclease
MWRNYRVILKTERENGQICASLPKLNNISDFGSTVEEALENLRKLAQFALECMQADGAEIPPSDRNGRLYLSLRVPQHSDTQRILRRCKDVIQTEAY